MITKEQRKELELLISEYSESKSKNDWMQDQGFGPSVKEAEDDFIYKTRLLYDFLNTVTRGKK